MAWLAAGVPLSLLCDLADAAGPDSRAINAVERPAGDSAYAEAEVALPGNCGVVGL